MKHAEQIVNVPALPDVILHMAESTLNWLDENIGENRDTTNGGYVVILTPDDSFEDLTLIGWSPDELYPDFTEAVDTGDGVYLCSVFFQTGKYYVNLFMPMADDIPPGFQDTFYLNMRMDELSYEFNGVSVDYYRLEGDLTDTYSDEQFALYVQLESAKENMISSTRETYYRQGFRDALNILYSSASIYRSLSYPQ